MGFSAKFDYVSFQMIVVELCLNKSTFCCVIVSLDHVTSTGSISTALSPKFIISDSFPMGSNPGTAAMEVVELDPAIQLWQNASRGGRRRWKRLRLRLCFGSNWRPWMLFWNCSHPRIKGAVIFHDQGPQIFDYSIRLNHTRALSGFPDVRSIMDTNGPYFNDLEMGVTTVRTMQYSFSGFLSVGLLPSFSNY